MKTPLISYISTENGQATEHSFHPASAEELHAALGHLAAAEHVTHIDINLPDADSNAIEALATVLAEKTGLEDLTIKNTPLGVKGLETLHDAVASITQLQSLEFRRTGLEGIEAAQALTRLLHTQPHLKSLSVDSTPLGEEGATLLAAELGALPRLETFSAFVVDAKEQGFNALASAVARHPSLRAVSLGGNMLNEHYAEQGISNSEIFDITMRAQDDAANLLLTHRPRNLLEFSPLNTNTQRYCHENLERVWEIHKLLLEEPESLDYTQASTLTAHFPAVSTASRLALPRRTQNIGNVEKPEEQLIAEFTQFIDSLPTLPDAAPAAAEALFRPDEKGYAPLDNPKLWQEPQKVLEYLDRCEQPLDEEFLARKTERGVDFLGAALGGVAPLPRVLPQLNRQGLQLQTHHLLDAPDKASPVLQALIERHEAPALFTRANWKGAHPQEMLSVLRQLPPEQQERLSNRHALTNILQQDYMASAERTR